jgi:hypothetical protein
MRRLALIAVMALAGCAAGGSPPLGSAGAVPQPAIVSAASRAGLYVAQYHQTNIYGYAGVNKRDAPPVCGESGVESVVDVAADPEGDLIVPNGNPHLVFVYKGPKMCGTPQIRILDPYGQPVDAASANATTGVIAVANVYDDGPITNPPPGSISLCDVAHDCTVNLTNPHMHEVAAVALDEAGDCWASAKDASGTATLVYFAHCAGKGRLASGYQNSGYGGLQVDKSGNLLAVDSSANALDVYSGCKPACKRVAGPFALQGATVYGKLDSRGKTFAAADSASGRIDVYKYAVTSLTYEFSFDQDLSRGSEVEGVAFTPAL